MGSGAAALRQLQRQLSKVPDQAVADLVRWFIPRSEEIGGVMRSWYGTDNQQLSSKLRTPRKRERSTAVRIVGTPAGAWAIKTYGRRGDYEIVPRRAHAIALSSFVDAYFASVHVDTKTSGDDRWNVLVLEADSKFHDVVAELVDRSLI